MVPMHAKGRKEAFHEPGNIEPRQKEECTRLRRAYGGQGMQNPTLSVNLGTSNIERRIKKTENGPLTPALSPKGEREKTSQKLHRVQATTFGPEAGASNRDSGPGAG